jgi:acetolactate synthase I/III small subunit
MEDRKHTISVMVENKFGVLARIAGLFSGRGYNIESLTVNHTNNDNVSKMTIVTRGDEAILEQIEKQLKKLVDVIKVTELTGEEFVERELALVKVKALPKNRAEIIQIVEIFGGKIAIVNKNELGVEISGPGAALDNFLSLIADFGVIEVARTGCVAVARGEGATESHSKL